jgi:hypothetical protein
MEMKCSHDGCNRKVEFELTGRWECNYHLGLDFEGDKMRPIRPLSEDLKPVPKGPDVRAIGERLYFYDSICPDNPGDGYRQMFNDLKDCLEELKHRK